MPLEPISQTRETARQSSEHPGSGENPRDEPIPRHDTTPPQPDAPPRSPIEETQDQQPVNPKPLIHRESNPNRGTREERNG